MTDSERIAELERQLAEPPEDTVLMDWLEQQRCFEVYPVLQSECTGYMRVIAVQNRAEAEGKTLRAAIRAAIARGAR